VIFEGAETVRVREGDVKDADEESGEEDGARGGESVAGRDGVGAGQRTFLDNDLLILLVGFAK
jgi:hypothetical protein